MKNEERLAKQQELIEELGIYFDKDGFQPIEGRILGLLTVMDKEEFTFEEIVELLKISKSSASNTLRNLEIRGAVEYVTFPGDRKRYFRIRMQDRFSRIEEFERKLQQFSEMSKRILKLKFDKNSRTAKYLVDIQEMFNLHIAYINQLKEKFRE